jgi:hypothetical protein
VRDVVYIGAGGRGRSEVAYASTRGGRERESEWSMGGGQVWGEVGKERGMAAGEGEREKRRGGVPRWARGEGVGGGGGLERRGGRERAERSWESEERGGRMRGVEEERGGEHVGRMEGSGGFLDVASGDTNMLRGVGSSVWGRRGKGRGEEAEAAPENFGYQGSHSSGGISIRHALLSLLQLCNNKTSTDCY